jgi:transglutaminase-like putative cysteine protease
MIDKPVPGVQTDARPHPAGGKGARLSLKEVAERAWKARMSPRLRAWAMQALAAAGVSTGGRRQKAQAILDAFRKKVPFIPDPVMGEFMATPNQTLCLDEGGLCFMGGDCDDHAIGLAAALMSIGIPAKIVGSSHHEPYDVPSHVFIAFEDDLGKWVRMDGTTQHPVGRVPPRAREFWVEPGSTAKETGQGDFVGMAGAHGALAAPSSVLDLLYPTIR